LIKARTVLIALYAMVLAVMLLVTGWATMSQPVWEWGGLTTPPDHAWTIATLVDAYFGFLTFFVWVWWKERRRTKRAAWFIAIMLLGNIAMAVYLLRELTQLRGGESMDVLLTRRNA
jgi:hypothetical protein